MKRCIFNCNNIVFPPIIKTYAHLLRSAVSDLRQAFHKSFFAAGMHSARLLPRCSDNPSSYVFLCRHLPLLPSMYSPDKRFFYSFRITCPKILSCLLSIVFISIRVLLCFALHKFVKCSVQCMRSEIHNWTILEFSTLLDSQNKQHMSHKKLN